MPQINFKKPELEKYLPIYEQIADCIKGEAWVKSKTEKYLPRPNPEDFSSENKVRYKNYLKRAVFYNSTRKTLDGMVGEITSLPVEFNLPTELEHFEKNIDGNGLYVEDFFKKMCYEVVAKGRCFVYADFPHTEDVISLKDEKQSEFNPFLSIVNAENAINWKTEKTGYNEKIVLVVIKETYVYSQDGFDENFEYRYRVLSVMDGIYKVEVWKLNDAGFQVIEGPFFPTDADGKNFTEIPGFFVGSANNDTVIDEPPLADLSTLNIAHYRNSADYEESCYMCGQPTPVFSGLTESWVSEIFKGKITLGSRGAVLLPEGGGHGLMQALPNSMPFEAMQMKEKQMVALGAKLTEQRKIQRTATETQIDKTIENSILQSSSNNIMRAMEKLFKYALKFKTTKEIEIHVGLKETQEVNLDEEENQQNNLGKSKPGTPKPVSGE